jgi:protein TonB
MLKETTDDLGPDAGVGVVGGVPGGVPGGTAGGVIGGIIGGAPKTFLPPVPAAPTPRAPVRVGGRVMEPRVISNPPPVYPPLAKQAKIQGDVQIDAVIDIHGNVVEMQVISGHPLLINAALDALRRWKYQPTILNDEPVPVQLIVTIRFRMQ